jgi:hypothetical protein
LTDGTRLKIGPIHTRTSPIHGKKKLKNRGSIIKKPQRAEVPFSAQATEEIKKG